MLGQKVRFGVKTFYKTLTPNGDHDFPLKNIWKPKVPAQVTFFIKTTKPH